MSIFATILILVLVVVGVILGLDARPESGPDQTPNQHSVVAPSTQVQGGWAEPDNSDSAENVPPLNAGDLNPTATPVLDMEYDDSWVANVPEIIGGFRVIRIDTPKSMACSVSPTITLLAPQRSMDEYLGTVSDVRSLLKSIPGIPPDVTLGFAGSPIDKEEAAANLARWNENMVREGCISFGRPKLPDP